MNEILNLSKVYIVGAGPGAIDLITVRALRVVQKADVILYDALVNEDLLGEAKSGAKKIYVGKRFNNHAYSQEDINKMLVSNAKEHQIVVRLKGGDPFVFGRGGEEVSYVREQGVEVEVIPGISSALAVPALQGIPLTQRNVNESFWVITGTTSDGEISRDIELAAMSTATLVVLMGLRNLSLIIEEVLRLRHKYTPIAIIQNGSLSNQTIYTETISNYKNLIDKIDYKSPGIIVIGDVVAEHHNFLSNTKLMNILKSSL